MDSILFSCYDREKERYLPGQGVLANATACLRAILDELRVSYPLFSVKEFTAMSTVFICTQHPSFPYNVNAFCVRIGRAVLVSVNFRVDRHTEKTSVAIRTAADWQRVKEQIETQVCRGPPYQLREIRHLLTLLQVAEPADTLPACREQLLAAQTTLPDMMQIRDADPASVHQLLAVVELHLQYAPGGPGAQAAAQQFEKLRDE